MKKLTKDNIIFAAVRWLVVIAFALLLILAASQNKMSSASIEDVSAAVSEAVDMQKMQQGSAGTFKRLYGLDSAQYESVVLYRPASNMDAEELLIVQLKDLGQQQEVKQAVEARLATQKKSFDGYGVEQYALLSDASVTDVQGNYVLFVVSENAVAADAAFRAAL